MYIHIHIYTHIYIYIYIYPPPIDPQKLKWSTANQGGPKTLAVLHSKLAGLRVCWPK